MKTHSLYHYMMEAVYKISEEQWDGNDVEDMQGTNYDIPEKNLVYGYLENLIDSSKNLSILSIFINEIEKTKTCESAKDYRSKDDFYFEFQATSFELGMILSMLLKIYFKNHMSSTKFDEFETNRKKIIDDIFDVENSIDDDELKEKMEKTLQPFIDLVKNTIVM